ncbi:MAG TPA: site-2 protease family protein [Bacillota bacterium]|nr:site-2 protease family protein [Bacillota bacterium]
MLVARIGGIRVQLNPYFLALLVLYFLAGVLTKALVVFGLVIYHELFHVLTAVRLGVRVTEIELLPFGGVARLDDILELRPAQEMKVAIAGPLANFLLLLALEGGEIYGIGGPELWEGDLIQYLSKANILMLAFNLIPALPLDGGRIYRAYLAPRLGMGEAARLAVGIGRGLALLLVGLGVVGLYFDVTGLDFFIIAIFMFFATGRERRRSWYAFLYALTEKGRELTSRGLLSAQVLVGRSDALLRDVVGLFVMGKYHLVLVLDENNQVAGWFNEDQVVEGLMVGGYGLRLADLLEEQQ